MGDTRQVDAARRGARRAHAPWHAHTQSNSRWAHPNSLGQLRVRLGNCEEPQRNRVNCGHLLHMTCLLRNVVPLGAPPPPPQMPSAAATTTQSLMRTALTTAACVQSSDVSTNGNRCAYDGGSAISCRCSECTLARCRTARRRRSTFRAHHLCARTCFDPNNAVVLGARTAKSVSSLHHVVHCVHFAWRCVWPSYAAGRCVVEVLRACMHACMQQLVDHHRLLRRGMPRGDVASLQPSVCCSKHAVMCGGH